MKNVARDRLRVIWLSARLLAGRFFWVLALVPLTWLGFQALLFLLPSGQGREQSFEPASAQGTLIGMPMTVLAIFLGARVIAGQLDGRLEIAYTVPGGSRRVWMAKLLGAWGILLASEVFLALAVYAFFTTYPPLPTLYGALQAATFYLVLSMGLAALFKSEVTGAMAAAGLLAVNGVLSGFGSVQHRLSPFWNSTALGDTEPSQLLAWALQNRIGFLLAIAALTALAFSRAERREKMLAG